MTSDCERLQSNGVQGNHIDHLHMDSHTHTRTGLKRITLFRDPDKGIGCTIKNAAGHILVNRILEDGPIALTGVLRPGEQCSGITRMWE